MGNADYVTLLYETFLGRPPDADGLAHYTSLLDAGHDLREVVSALAGSEEYARRKPRDSGIAITRDLPLHRPLVIVDVGAQSLADEMHIYAPLLTSGRPWRCIGFEPNEERRRARLDSEADPRLTMLDAFVGDGASHLFRLVSDDGSSSLLPLNDPFNKAFEHISTLTTLSEEPVETSRLDDLLVDEAKIDFLKFDIQGFESCALRHSTDVLTRTNVVHCECFFGPMYRDQGYFSDIDALLRAAGFEFIDFSHLARYRYIDVPRPSQSGERLIWADAVYFRTLGAASDDQNDHLAQPIIAETIYRKPGLAQHILQTSAPHG